MPIEADINAKLAKLKAEALAQQAQDAKDAAAAKKKEEKKTPNDPSIGRGNYEEITYNHAFYKGIGVQNPTLAFVWVVLPNILDGTETETQLIDKLKTLSKDPAQGAEKQENLYTLPQNLINFRLERFLYGVGTFTLQLYDNNFTDIEEKLIKHKGLIGFQYGYTANRSEASPWHVGFLTSYSVQFRLEGTYITIHGISMGWSVNTVKEALPYNDVNSMAETSSTLSDFVDKMAQKHGFTTPESRVIETTLTVMSRGVGLKDNQKWNMEFNALTKDSFFEHIITTIIPYAINKDNQGGYVFYVEPTKKNGAVFHFHTINYKIPSQKDKPIKLFTQFKSPNTVVRSFNPSWATAIRQLRDSGKVAGIGVDPINKLVLSKEVSIKQAQTHMIGGSRNTIIALPGENSGATTSVLFPGPTQSAMEAHLNTKLHTASLQAIEATLEIQGTPDIEMLETVAVHVYIPKGPHKINKVTGNSQVHWISGEFKVKRIIDEIANGDFKTTLELITGGREIFFDSPVGKDQKG